MKKTIKLLSLLLAFSLIFALVSCGEKDSADVTKVTISVRDYGDITLELYPQYAPETVANFVKLANEGFYENVIFHRIYKDFMIQGGGFETDTPDTQKPADRIKGEFSANGFKDNTLSHKRGVISMARANDPNSASSQFFIVHQDSEFLDGNYAAFGMVIEGMDVVDAIAEAPVQPNMFTGEVSDPLNPPVIDKVTVIE